MWGDKEKQDTIGEGITAAWGRERKMTERVQCKWRKTVEFLLNLKTEPTGLADRLDVGCER